MTLEIVRTHERILKEDANMSYGLTASEIKKRISASALTDFAQAVYRK